uniref:Uncharacterized protein n=1 Tax=Glossina austeni TaxID=7395 RepID=A0A1A9UDG2_GLOAU
MENKKINKSKDAASNATPSNNFFAPLHTINKDNLNDISTPEQPLIVLQILTKYLLTNECELFKYTTKGERPYKGVLFGLDKQKPSIIKTHLTSMDPEYLGIKLVEKKGSRKSSQSKTVKCFTTALLTVKLIHFADVSINSKGWNAPNDGNFLNNSSTDLKICALSKKLKASYSNSQIALRTIKTKAEQFEVTTSLILQV